LGLAADRIGDKEGMFIVHYFFSIAMLLGFLGFRF